jgi:hypothetical protein
MRLLCCEFWLTVWSTASCKRAKAGLRLPGLKKQLANRRKFCVTTILMHPHEPRHSYERCIVCHKPFHVYRSRLLRPGGMFCTQRCFWQAWAVFRRVLANGQLETILDMPVSQEVVKDKCSGHTKEVSCKDMRGKIKSDAVPLGGGFFVSGVAESPEDRRLEPVLTDERELAKTESRNAV